MPTEPDLQSEGFTLVTPKGFMVDRFHSFITKINSQLKRSFKFST